MKKLFKGLLLAGILASSVSAAKVATADEFGRLYNTAYFDIKTDKQSPVFDIIGYSKRAGTFDWTKLYNVLSTVDADKIEFKVSARVEVPQGITTDDVYISTGENIVFQKENCCKLREKITLSNTSMTKSSSSRSVFLFSTLFNDNKITTGNALLTKSKNDNFGNRYVDLALVMTVDMADDKDYIPSTKANLQSVIKHNFDKFLSGIKIKVAPKSRTFQNKWVEPKIYVMDE